jgi:hypothetical protein
MDVPDLIMRGRFAAEVGKTACFSLLDCFAMYSAASSFSLLSFLSLLLVQVYRLPSPLPSGAVIFGGI